MVESSSTVWRPSGYNPPPVDVSRPFDYFRTPTGVKRAGEGFDDAVSVFRNVTRTRPNDPRLPPSLRARYFDMFENAPTVPQRGVGINNVMRQLGGGSEFVTIEAGTQIPVTSPMFTVDRAKQRSAWTGDKRSQHANIFGTFPVSEAQSFLMGDEIPQDVYDYEVNTDSQGNVRVVDETGVEVPKMVYWPFTRDQQGVTTQRADELPPLLQAGWGGALDESGRLPPESAIRGQRRLSQAERFGRPLPHPVSGSVDWMLVRPGQAPVAMPQRTTFPGQRVISTTQGAFFIDGDPLAGEVVQRSESDDIHFLANVMVKMLLPEL